MKRLIMIVAALGLILACSGDAGSNDLTGAPDPLMIQAYEAAGATYYKSMMNQLDEFDGPVIALESVRFNVRIVNSYDQYPHALAQKRRVPGYYDPSTETIWIYGRYYKTKIVLNPAVLGHEIMHVLQYRNHNFLDPDVLYNRNVGGVRSKRMSTPRNLKILD